MSTLVSRYEALKRRVGGNREKTTFEFTFGTPREELHQITPPSAPIRRILAELHYALQVSQEARGAYDLPICDALTTLEEAMDAESVLPRTACMAAEQALLPLAEAAKRYEVICAAHAHIDMNWMWGWQETVAATLSTFRTMLQLMREYPDFCFSQSQASVYQIVETYDPALMPEIQQRIREGRWEVTATAWVETDKNMPDTASLLQHIQQTRDYLQTVWGIDPDSLQVDFSPDTFGHSAQVPEINAFGNVPYYYHCRGDATEQVLYRWQAPSGREVLVYREPYWYNSGITPDIGTGVIALSKYSGGLQTGLIVYGVGDHGGGPTRRDVERILEMQTWPIFPRIRFGTFHEYFHKAERVRENLPIVRSELNPIFSGCYSTQSRIKLGNRRAEAALLDAETFSALATLLCDAPYPRKSFTRAWQETLFTHFHDILTGSCVQESREHAMGLFADVLAVTGTAHANALRTLSGLIDTRMLPEGADIAASQSEGAGVGYGLAHYAGIPNPERGAGRIRAFHAFNPCPCAQHVPVEMTLWDWPHDLRRVQVTDGMGHALPFQLLDNEMQKYWDHHFFRVLVQTTLPALGYATMVLDA
ncbi:MAG: alpha-mannosidase, partial [Clostridia bacterium]